MQLVAGVDCIQVSRRLGHSTYTLALDTYGDWIPRKKAALATTPRTRGRRNADARPSARAVERYPAIRTLNRGNQTQARCGLLDEVEGNRDGLLGHIF